MTAMSPILQDLRYAIRRLRKSPPFTVTVLLVLALGIGATTALFSVVDAVLLDPLPYPEADRLYKLRERVVTSGKFEEYVAPATYRDWRASGSVFADLGAAFFELYNLTGASEPEQLRAARVDAGFFAVFGVKPLLGRLPAADDAAADGAAVISHSLWQRQLGARPDVVGTSLELNGQTHRVLGVMPEDFTMPSWADLWMPLGHHGDRGREWRAYEVYGRLGNAVTPETARAELEVLAQQLANAYPETHRDLTATLQSLYEIEVGSVRATVWTLFGAGLGLLLIVWLNVAGLQVARGLERRGELAIRTALGAGRTRTMWQLVTENLVLALGGGVFGLLLARWGLDFLVTLAPSDVPYLEEAAVDRRAVLVTVAATLSSGTVLGLLTALRSTDFEVAEALKLSRATARPRWGWLDARSLLVTVQISLTVLFLIGAGLLGKSFLLLSGQDAGFHVDRLATAGLVLSPDQYPEPRQRVTFLREVTERLESAPQVERVAAGNFLPLKWAKRAVRFSAAEDRSSEAIEREAYERVVTHGYFETLGLPLLAGRTFTATDDDSHPDVVVVNQVLARDVWGDANPVGRSLVLIEPGGRVTAEVVGVVAALRPGGPRAELGPELYRAHAQNPWSYMNLIVRSSAGSMPREVLPLIRQAVREVDPRRPLFGAGTMPEQLDFWHERPRFNALLMTLFSSVALLLAAIGLFGVMAFSVRRRQREIGIRMALGAWPDRVRAMVLGEGLKLAVIGLALGLVGAAATTRLLGSMLHEVSAHDAATWILVAALVLATTLCAAAVPATRASRMTPVEALRED